MSIIRHSATALAALALAAFSHGPARAQEDPVAVANSIYSEMFRLWNDEGRSDSDPSMFTEDADLINAFGPHWSGAEEIAANGRVVQDSFRPTIGGDLVSAVEIAPGVIVAIMHGVGTIPEGAPGAGAFELMQSTVLVKQGDDWKIRFLQSTPIAAPPVPLPQ